MSNKSASKKSRKRQQKKIEKQVEKDSLKDQGNQAFGAGKYDAAIALYAQALEEDKTNHVVYSNRSAAYCALKEWDLALKDSEKVIELDSKWSKGYLRQGQALYGAKQFVEAQAAYNEGLKYDSNNESLKTAYKEITVLIEELTLSAEEAKESANPENEKFRIFLKWLDSGNVQYDNLFIRYYDLDYRGVHMKTSVPKDEIILEVPLSHIMTSEVAKASEIGRKLIASQIDLISTHSYLASFLLFEKSKGSDSFWKPYIDTLPQEYGNMPIFFRPDELAWMKASFSFKKMKDQFNSLQIEYQNICKHVPIYSKFTLHEFIWARTAVITRIFGMVINDNKTDGLVPMADMLNHKRPRETSWVYDDKRQSFTITTLTHLDRGVQVFDSYGRKCNSRYFVNYGFALESNEEDNEAVMFLSTQRDDQHYQLKVRLLDSLGHRHMADFQFPMSYRDKKTRTAFSFLRIAHAKEKEMLLLGSREEKKDEEIDPISINNEISVLESLQEAAINRIQLFDTTLEEDYELLKLPKDTFSSNVRNAILMRKGEKEVLHYYRDLAKLCIPFLRMPWKDLKKKIGRMSADSHSFDYFVKAIGPLVKNSR